VPVLSLDLHHGTGSYHVRLHVPGGYLEHRRRCIHASFELLAVLRERQVGNNLLFFRFFTDIVMHLSNPSCRFSFAPHLRNTVMSKIVAGRFAFKGRRWKRISSQAKEFVSDLLEYNPEDRPTAEEAQVSERIFPMI